MPSTTYETTQGGTSAETIKVYDTQGVMVGEVIRGKPGKLISVDGFNNAVATRYIMLFNGTAVPANGTVPYVTPIAVSTGANFSFTMPGGRLSFPTGIVWASSTTATSLTITVGADVWLTAAYQ